MGGLARTFRVAPSFRLSLPAVLSTPWAMLAVVLSVGIALNVALPVHVSSAVLNPMGATIGIAAVGGMRRAIDTTAFNLVAGGVLVYAIADVLAYASMTPQLEAFATGLFVAAYAAFAAGLTHFFTGRTRR